MYEMKVQLFDSLTKRKNEREREKEKKKGDRTSFCSNSEEDATNTNAVDRYLQYK